MCVNFFTTVGAGGSVGTRQFATAARALTSTSASPANSAVRMCIKRSIFASATCRIVTHAERKFFAAVSLRKISSGIAAPVS